MIKFSILAMYRRVFTISRGFNRALIIVGLIVLGWMISVTIAQIFTCAPIEGAWDPMKAKHCIDQKKFYYGNAISNVITDVMLLAMPLPIVWKLNMSIKKKINVTLVFILGGLYVVPYPVSHATQSLTVNLACVSLVFYASVPSHNSTGTTSLVWFSLAQPLYLELTNISTRHSRQRRSLDRRRNTNGFYLRQPPALTAYLQDLEKQGKDYAQPYGHRRKYL
jgi:hypothetical protein